MAHRQFGNRRGFVLITTTACLIAFLAFVGLATDVGRLYVSRNELQTFVDEAAFAASFELDGTSVGISRATSTGMSGPGSGATVNHWYFGTQTVPGVTVEFATSAGGPFYSDPAPPAGYRFVKVRANATVKLYFLPVVPGIPGTQGVTASAIAGQVLLDSLGDGLAPFSPDAHDSADPDFGFSPGQLYTLRWAPPGHRGPGGDSCPGDVGYNPDDPSWRGYIDVGQGNGNSALRDAIVNNTYNLTNPLEVGSPIDDVSGQKSVTEAINERFSQDTDVSSADFADYHGNGRRLYTVAVNTGNPPRVAGFALFFMQPIPCGDNNTSPCCGEYVGASVIGSVHRGAGRPALYAVKLVQ